MGSVDTISGATGNIFWFLGDVAFNWVPATIAAVTGVAPGAGNPAPLISQPVSMSDAIAYFAQSSPPGQYADLYARWQVLVAVSIALSVIFGAIIAYSVTKLIAIRKMERARLMQAAHPVAARDIPKTQLRWNRVMEEADSEDERRWRLAILEADIMLNEVLDILGYKGETMGDKMKRVERADFRTIDLAWEAHRVRNSIAHEGSAHLLNAREVRRVMNLYEQIFREFNIIV